MQISINGRCGWNIALCIGNLNRWEKFQLLRGHHFRFPAKISLLITEYQLRSSPGWHKIMKIDHHWSRLNYDEPSPWHSVDHDVVTTNHKWCKVVSAQCRMNAKRKEYMHEVVPFFMPGHLCKAHDTSQPMSFSAGSNRTFDTSEARCTIISPSLNQMVLKIWKMARAII